jgi:uncharacterized repeat protein (TIGR03943 family)
MSRGTQNTLVLLIGLSAVVMVIKGTYLHFVKPSLLPWLIAAAVVLIALAVTSIVRDLRAAPTADEHEHRHRSWLVWLLLVPIALTTFVVPPPLGAQGAAPEAVAAPQKRAFPPLPAGRAPTVSIPDVVMRAAADSTNSLDRRVITLAGFTVRNPEGTDLGRVVIVCCAADAQLARVHLSGAAAAEAAGYPDDTWLQVEGTVVPGTSTVSTNFVPTVAVSRVTRIDKPANTYAY